jgi:hypothetical protein
MEKEREKGRCNLHSWGERSLIYQTTTASGSMKRWLLGLSLKILGVVLGGLQTTYSNQGGRGSLWVQIKIPNLSASDRKFEPNKAKNETSG